MGYLEVRSSRAWYVPLDVGAQSRTQARRDLRGKADRGAGYWQASQVGPSIKQAMASVPAGAIGTALSLPSVPLSVDFST
jgi:hypothetical protein